LIHFYKRDLEKVYFGLMAQGKLKAKNKGNVPASKKKHDKKPSNLKKGKHFIAPKKKQHQEDHKFKKNIQKLINANLEKEIKGKAKNFDPKAFEVIDKEAGASSSKE